LIYELKQLDLKDLRYSVVKVMVYQREWFK